MSEAYETGRRHVHREAALEDMPQEVYVREQLHQDRADLDRFTQRVAHDDNVSQKIREHVEYLQGRVDGLESYR